MTLNEFLNLIGYSEQAKNTFYKNQVSESCYTQKKQEYYLDETAFLNNLQKSEKDNYNNSILHKFPHVY